MPPRKRKKATPADQADPRDIHIQASATVGQAEGTHVTGAVVNVPDAQSVQVGEQHNVTTSGGDYAGRDMDKRQGVFVEGGTVHGDVIGQQFVTQYQPPAPIDPVAAAEQLAALPLDTIPDLAPLPSGSRMPLSRNPLFVGREDDLKHLAVALKAGGTAAIGQIAAATGLGGIGKTNLATEFVHRYGQYFAGGVFWLSFADAAAVPAEVAACGVGLDLPGFADLKLDDQVARVRHLWQESIPRLLVFDNCEDETLLDQWRPTSGGSRLLITSRRAHWSKVLNVAALALGVLSRSESIMLLRKHRPDLATDDSDLDAIAAELGYLPLALHLAGSYLETYRDDPDLGNPAAFLAELRDAHLLEHTALQGEDVTPSPTNHTLHVGRTFALSYDRLRPNDAVDAVALALLARAACFAPGEPIPRDLLLATIEVPNKATKRRASKAIRRLVDLGLLEAGFGSVLTLHRLLGVFVQAVAQDGEAQVAVEEAIYVEARRLSDKGVPAPLLAVQAHLRSVTDRAVIRNDELAAHLCTAFGFYLQLIGEYRAARRYVERALVIRQIVLGEQNPDTAASLNNLGLLLKYLGDMVGARPYYEQALAINRAMLGEAHFLTAKSLNNLGTLLQAMGDLAGAQSYLEQALAIFKQVLGEAHPDMTWSLNNLGMLLKEIGDLKGARRYLEEALAVNRKVLGEEHPSTATSLNNLGMLLQDTGDLAGARPYLEQALAVNRKVLGEEHPSTATSLNNLGRLLRAQGDLVGARTYYEQALAILQRVLGEEHPNTASNLNNLAVLHAHAGEFPEAIVLMRRVLAMHEAILGPQHPDTQSSRRSLAVMEKDAQQIAAIREQADVAVAHILAGADTQARVTLAEQLEQTAQQIEASEEPGSPYLALAAHLRELIARLRAGEGDDAPREAG